MRIVPATKKDWYALASRIHAFIADELKEDIHKLPEDMVEGIHNKYKEKYIDPYEDLT